MTEKPSPAGLTLWETGRRVTRRVAVGGDFLPAMDMQNVSPQLWYENAKYLKAIFADIDCAIVNMECPLACSDLPVIPKSGRGANLSGSEKSLEYLRELNINLVGLANNHMCDYGREGILKTQDALSSGGIDFIGAYSASRDRPDIHIINLGGVKIGFWAAFLNSDKTPGDRFGVEAVSPNSAKNALEQMGNGISIRIALVHAGLERTNYPDPTELRHLNKIAEDGFDLVAACHSHRISGYGQIKRLTSSNPGFCFYGLGSILSGCIYGALEREGLIVVLGLDASGKISQLQIRPVWLDGPGWGIVPQKDENQLILNRFEAVSMAIEDGTFKKLFYSDMGQGLWLRTFDDFRTAYQNMGLAGIMAKLRRVRFKHVNRILQKAVLQTK